MHYGYEIGIEELWNWLPLLLPLLILQVILISVALWDLLKRDHSNEYKWLWAAIIVFVSIFGPILYFTVGRRER
ncbi:PLD nuclease N-terminal domain-containing protein [Bacillus sp. 3103sda1]|uniref:PLD nuclease N-terminal domain-containing protein n=1 Tax=Bacillus sp. 3103sda1 TaxID=2953808 RepID=UPI00209F446D|nr:PLD nuclease N-terminal domain-containing protein [Bacillus sp. 3103sda1]MCP1122805.1 PLD nuclease N-terminal domain-containing protein [Bacillus sp. 3103sda1]